ALAVTYCEMRSGVLPFRGNVQQIMSGHLLNEPDLAPLPEAERPVVARALAKKPEERWPGCRQFVEALAEAGQLRSPGEPTVVPRRPRGRAVWAAGAAGLLALAFVPFLFVFLGGGSEKTPPPKPVPTPDGNAADEALARKQAAQVAQQARHLADDKHDYRA